MKRIALSALGAFVAYFVVGTLTAAVPSLRSEFLRYPAIYRTPETMKAVMPLGVFAIFLSVLVLAVLYAMLYKGRSGVLEGMRFGALIAVFAVTAFVVHNYVNLNIGLKLTVIQAAVYLVMWVVVGLTIGLIYRPKSI